MRKLSKLLATSLLAVLVLLTGVSAVALVNGGSAEEPASSGNEIEISQNVLDAIQSADPDRYERNVANYKQLLESLDVDDSYRQEIETLIVEGYSVPKIMISYEFLYQSFGLISELEPLVSQKTPEITWEAIFSEYNSNHEPFVPRTFASAELEKLTSIPSLSSDDIMIADRISHVTGKIFDELIAARLDALHWKEITVGAGVLYSADTLPRVQVTVEQIDLYTGEGGLTEDQVIEAFVLAHKVGKEAKAVIDRIKAGDSEEAILADSYIEQYE